MLITADIFALQDHYMSLFFQDHFSVQSQGSPHRTGTLSGCTQRHIFQDHDMKQVTLQSLLSVTTRWPVISRPYPEYHFTDLKRSVSQRPEHWPYGVSSQMSPMNSTFQDHLPNRTVLT